MFEKRKIVTSIIYSIILFGIIFGIYTFVDSLLVNGGNILERLFMAMALTITFIISINKKKKIQEIKESQSEIDWNKIKNSLIITMMISTVIIFILFYIIFL